jgi:hypothetical protein
LKSNISNLELLNKELLQKLQDSSTNTNNNDSEKDILITQLRKSISSNEDRVNNIIKENNKLIELINDNNKREVEDIAVDIKDITDMLFDGKNSQLFTLSDVKNRVQEVLSSIREKDNEICLLKSIKVAVENSQSISKQSELTYNAIIENKTHEINILKSEIISLKKSLHDLQNSERNIITTPNSKLRNLMRENELLRQQIDDLFNTRSPK